MAQLEVELYICAFNIGPNLDATLLHWVQSFLLLRSKIGELLRLPRPLCLMVDSSRDTMKFCGFPCQYFVGTDDSAACEFGGLGALMSSVTLLCHSGSACSAGHGLQEDRKSTRLNSSH